MFSTSRARYLKISEHARDSQDFALRIKTTSLFTTNDLNSKQKTIQVKTAGGKITRSIENTEIEFYYWDDTHTNSKFLINTKPVYVEKSEDGKEILKYSKKKMLQNKLYEVVWSGQKVGLVKTRQQEIVMYEEIKK